MNVDFTTIKVIGSEPTTHLGTRERVTVEITLHGKTLTVEAARYPESPYTPQHLYLLGFVGRYRTSTKAWPATVKAGPDGKVYAYFGRDDRSGRFNKLAGISYEPAQ